MPQPATEDITRVLLAADGYIELGMLDHAAEELEDVTPEASLQEDVLLLRRRVYLRARRWEALQDVAKHLVTINPMNVENWIWAAYATRLAESVWADREILRGAKACHPEAPIIDFNLACFTCRLGDHRQAGDFLLVAIRANGAFRQMALDDGDLEPLWC